MAGGACAGNMDAGMGPTGAVARLALSTQFSRAELSLPFAWHSPSLHLEPASTPALG